MLRNLTIMLVEDDPDISAIVSLALQLDGDLTVLSEQCGSHALERLESVQTPDLILVDNHLPDMDGVVLAKAINDGRPQPIAIAFLTASVRSADHDRYREAGAVGVIAKPFNPLTLASEIRALLGLKERFVPERRP